MLDAVSKHHLMEDPTTGLTDERVVEILCLDQGKAFDSKCCRGMGTQV